MNDILLWSLAIVFVLALVWAPVHAFRKGMRSEFIEVRSLLEFGAQMLVALTLVFVLDRLTDDDDPISASTTIVVACAVTPAAASVYFLGFAFARWRNPGREGVVGKSPS